MMKFLLFLLLFCSSVYAVDKVVVVFDDSGSMDESLGNVMKIDAAKQGVLQVLSKLPDNCMAGVVCINSNWRLPLGPLNRNELKAAISPILSNGGTLLAPCMKKGADALLSARKKDPYGKCRILIVTDGEAQDPTDVQAFTNDILAKGIILDVIGVKMESEHQLAKQARTYRNVTNPETLNEALNEALAEIPSSNEESNFDLISPIDEGVAEKMLKAVCEVSNEPISERDHTSHIIYPTTGPAQISSPAEGSLSFYLCLIIVFVIIAICAFKFSSTRWS